MIKLNHVFVHRQIINKHLLVPIVKNDISNDVLYLNEVAALIIEECKEKNDIDELVGLISKRFVDDDIEKISMELRDYIQELLNSGILLEE